MGRPLQKKFFGNPEGTGIQLVLSAVWLAGSTEAETGFYVVRQVGTGRYQVTNGSKSGVVKLVDALPTAPGEGVIVVRPFGTDLLEFAKKIHNRTVVTFDGNTYKWSRDPAEENGQADLAFETWESIEDLEEELNPEPSHVAVLHAVAFEGGIGFTQQGSIGSLDDEFDLFGDISPIGYYEDNLSRLYIAGDHPEISAIEITIGEVTIVYGYNGSEGATEFLSEEKFGFVDSQSYSIRNVVVIPSQT
jgi:hypothetical protein